MWIEYEDMLLNKHDNCGEQITAVTEDGLKRDC
jgi:hypothetical protein